MEIKRSQMKDMIRKVCEEAERGNLVFISHYGEVRTVMIGKHRLDELLSIEEKWKAQNVTPCQGAGNTKA